MGCMQLSDLATTDEAQREKELLSIRMLITTYFEFTTSSDTSCCLKYHPIIAEKELSKVEQSKIEEAKNEASISVTTVTEISYEETKEAIDPVTKPSVQETKDVID